MDTIGFLPTIDPFTRRAGAPITLPAPSWISLDDRLPQDNDGAEIILPAHVIDRMGCK